METTNIGQCTLIQDDCIEVMQNLIKQGVKVDAIITDPPYGTTACKWDSVIPFEPMWDCLHKLIKDNGAIILFGREPFTSKLITSNIKKYKHKWVWNKKQSGSWANAKYMPLQIEEDIICFANGRVNYYPIMRKGKMRKKGGSKKQPENMGKIKHTYYSYSDEYYPVNILEIPNCSNKKNNVHPTQKPISLMEYLVKTYTNEGDVVLDFTAGSFTTGVACQNTNRKFIGIELEEQYYEIGVQRMKENKERLERNK